MKVSWTEKKLKDRCLGHPELLEKFEPFFISYLTYKRLLAAICKLRLIFIFLLICCCWKAFLHQEGLIDCFQLPTYYYTYTITFLSSIHTTPFFCALFSFSWTYTSIYIYYYLLCIVFYKTNTASVCLLFTLYHEK